MTGSKTLRKIKDLRRFLMGEDPFVGKSKNVIKTYPKNRFG